MRSPLRTLYPGWLIALAWTVLTCAAPAAAPEPTDDELTLQKARVATDSAGVLDFFRKRTLTGDYQKRIDGLVKQLADDSAKARKKARLELIAVGPPALPALRVALKSPEDVVQVLARECIDVLEKDPGPALPLAAVRLLRERKPAGACSVLLGYLPFADNKDVQEEVLEDLVLLGSHAGKTDAALLAALKDKHPLRRGGAAYAVGRLGRLGERAAVRELLGDADAAVRMWAGEGLVSREIYQVARNSAAADEKLLKSKKIEPTETGLLAFFHKRTLTPEVQQRLREWVRQLGSAAYKERKKAEYELKHFDSSALPYLRPALKDPDVEVRARANKCIAEIERGPATALPAAAVRLLTLRAPEKAVAVLLAYAPFADDEMVEEEVQNALSVLSVRGPALSPALSAALKDQAPARRATAASVLGRVGAPADLARVRPLLADPDATVRFQAASTVFASRDKAAVPVLVALLDNGPVELARKAEELLAGVSPEPVSKTELTEKAADRRKVREAWAAWWRTNGDKVDMSQITLDTLLVREMRARQITTRCLNAFLHLDAAAFKKTLKFPCYLPFGPNGNGEIKSGQQIDQFFKLIKSQGGAKAQEQFKRIKFKVTTVSGLEQFLKIPLDNNRRFMAAQRQQEDKFLKRYSKRELLITHVAATMDGRPQPEEVVVFVRMTGGRAWVVGLGQGRGQVKAKR
jgi:HEAT repeat protein